MWLPTGHWESGRPAHNTPCSGKSPTTGGGYAGRRQFGSKRGTESEQVFWGEPCCTIWPSGWIQRFRDSQKRAKPTLFFRGWPSVRPPSILHKVLCRANEGRESGNLGLNLGLNLILDSRRICKREVGVPSFAEGHPVYLYFLELRSSGEFGGVRGSSMTIVRLPEIPKRRAFKACTASSSVKNEPRFLRGFEPTVYARHVPSRLWHTPTCVLLHPSTALRLWVGLA